jgi:hypothetical protein
MNLMLINVSTRKFRRAVRLPAGDVPAPAGSGVSMGGKIVRTIGIARARFKDRDDELGLQHPPPGSARAGGGCARLRAFRVESVSRVQKGPRGHPPAVKSAPDQVSPWHKRSKRSLSYAEIAESRYCSRCPKSSKAPTVVVEP